MRRPPPCMRWLLYAYAVLLSLHATFAAHFEVFTPYDGEIFDEPDAYFEFQLHVPTEGGAEPPQGEILLSVNGNGAFRTREAYVRVNAPGLAKGLHALTLQWVPDGADAAAAYHELAFEVTRLQAPEDIIPLPPGTVGVRSDALPIHPDADTARFSSKVQRLFFHTQHPEEARCARAPFLIWEPWGIVGFGAQILGLRVALALGLGSGRVVVGNPEWENNLVNSELKWRFNLTDLPDTGSPWGAGGSLQQLSHCAQHSSVSDSVRLLPGVDIHDHSISNVRVSGDLWGVENREHIFDIPAAAAELLPQAPNLFWWWTETTAYLHRPTPKLQAFVKAQKVRMGWKHPIIGIHMRLGHDKNREAQRFPNKYYIAEARRIRALFPEAGTIFVCSDRRGAVDKMIASYGGEFEIMTQPRVDGAQPMDYVHTDLTLLGEADFLIFTFSSNFGMAAFYLNSFNHNHRPTYVSMDDLFEGFRYYGHQMTLTYNAETGTNELGVRNCAPQVAQPDGRVLLIIDDKREDAEEICAPRAGGEQDCRTPRVVRDQATGGEVWNSRECEPVDDWDACQEKLRERFRALLSASTAVREKGECEEECDDHGCVSLAEGNRRVLGFGMLLPRDEL